MKNTGPLFRMVWESSPQVVTASLLCRLLAALVPLAMLVVTRSIIDSIYALTSHRTPLSHHFWLLVALEFGLASLGTVLSRLLDFCDTALADSYSRHISTRTMEHAAKLDLTYYEDPFFYDKLDRARVQGTDRLGMIQASGRLLQEVITASSLAASIYLFSPWILIDLFSARYRHLLARRTLRFWDIHSTSNKPARSVNWISAAIGWQQRERKGTETLWARSVFGRSVPRNL